MSKYTTEIRFLCESLAGLTVSEGYNSIENIIENARTKIFNFDYPIFDVNYKPVLETKILKHYYTREIGEETVGLWKLRLNARMNEIMPYYNKLYQTELLKFDPLEDTNLKTTSNRTIDRKENESGNSITHLGTTSSLDTVGKDASAGNFAESGDNSRTENTTDNLAHEDTNRFWDTPQNGLQPLTDATYLTDARKINSSDDRTIGVNENGDYSKKGSNSGTVDRTETQTGNGTSDGTGSNTVDRTGNSVDDYLNTVIGKRGNMTYSQMVMEYRNTFINLDMMVIKDLSDLFMNIW